MIGGGLVDVASGIDAERTSLESVARPLAEAPSRPGLTGVPGAGPGNGAQACKP